MRKFLLPIMFILLISLCFFSIGAAEESPLSFSDSQDFKVLILADTQDTDNPQPAMIKLLNAVLDHSQPDLVVFLGDMIHGNSIQGKEKVEKAIDAIIQPVVRRDIPFALVFGNHDDRCDVSKEEQLAIYQSYPGCLAVEGDEMPGCGNYYILIENPVHPQSPLVLWFLDSGTYAEPGRGTYGYVTEEQNSWMLQTAESISSRYEAPASYVFQHIPVPQVYDMLNEVAFGTKDAVTCYGPYFMKWFVPNPDYIWDGALGEGPCSSEYDSGEFDAWKKVGIKAAFFGHDHLNSYSGTLDGIDLIATPGLGFYLYGRGEEHGARLLTFHADQLPKWDSQMLYYRDVVDDPLPGLFVSTLGVQIQNYVFLGLAGLILIIALIVLLIHSLRKKRKRNHAEA